MLTIKKLLLTTLLIATTVAASATVLTSGLLKDETGIIDPITQAKVIMVANMGGMKDDSTGKMNWRFRYVGIEIPRLLKPKQIIVLDQNNREIQHKDFEVHEFMIDEKGKKGTLLKLFLEHTAGFSFQLKIVE